MPKAFKDCNAFIYDGNGDLMANVDILEHDDEEQFIVVPDAPALIIDKLCEVVIMTEPAPHTYKGSIHKSGGRKRVRLYKGVETENRKEPRYKIDVPANIIRLIYNGELHTMLTPVAARLINISRGGMRFRSVLNALSKGDRFQISVKGTGGNDKLLIADVVFRADTPEHSEYGCRLVEKDAERYG